MIRGLSRHTGKSTYAVVFALQVKECVVSLESQNYE